MITDPYIQPTADRPGQAGIGDRLVGKARGTGRSGRCRTCQLGKFGTLVSSTDQRVSKRLPRSAVPIVLDLNAAEKVVQGISVPGIDGNRPVVPGNTSFNR